MFSGLTICNEYPLLSPSVSGSLFERLGSRGAQLAQPLVERVGAICAEAAEAEAERDEGEEGAPYESAAAGAMGAAIRHLGPQQVLAVLPLNIAEVFHPQTDPPGSKKHRQSWQAVPWVLRLVAIFACTADLVLYHLIWPAAFAAMSIKFGSGVSLCETLLCGSVTFSHWV